MFQNSPEIMSESNTLLEDFASYVSAEEYHGEDKEVGKNPSWKRDCFGQYEIEQKGKMLLGEGFNRSNRGQDNAFDKYKYVQSNLSFISGFYSRIFHCFFYCFILECRNFLLFFFVLIIFVRNKEDRDEKKENILQLFLWAMSFFFDNFKLLLTFSRARKRFSPLSN